MGTPRLRRTAACTRCLRCTGALRRPASGFELSPHFLPHMPPFPAPGSPTSILSRTSTPSWPSSNGRRLGTPILAQSVPRGRSIWWLHWFAFAKACRVARPLYRSDWDTFPSHRRLYFQAFNGSVSLPLLYTTTTATGLLCWRDSHPLEWQLASLHDNLQPTHLNGYPSENRALSQSKAIQHYYRKIQDCCRCSCRINRRHRAKAVPKANKTSQSRQSLAELFSPAVAFQ